MKPVIALVGRPNVGKSTLFNRLTRSRDAIVEDVPGVTRDALYGIGRVGERDYMVVDTGGIEPLDQRDAMKQRVQRQVAQVIEDCTALVLVVDGRAGLTSEDRDIVDVLRGSDKPVWVVVNKSEGLVPEVVMADFHQLGLKRIAAVSALHGDGVNAFCHRLLAELPHPVDGSGDEDTVERIAISIVGRPNVGKSTLVNTLLGEERVVVFDQPGTTRDSVRIPSNATGGTTN